MNAIEESDADEDRGSNEENEKEKADTRSAKDAMAHDATVGTAVDCNNVLTFFQVAALKAHQVLAAPLSLQVGKRATSWFFQWAESNLKQNTTLHKTA